MANKPPGDGEDPPLIEPYLLGPEEDGADAEPVPTKYPRLARAAPQVYAAPVLGLSEARGAADEGDGQREMEVDSISDFLELEAAAAVAEDSDAEEVKAQEAVPLTPLPQHQGKPLFQGTDEELAQKYAPNNEHLSAEARKQLGDRKRVFKKAEKSAKTNPFADFVEPMPEEEQENIPPPENQDRAPMNVEIPDELLCERMAVMEQLKCKWIERITNLRNDEDEPAIPVETVEIDSAFVAQIERWGILECCQDFPNIFATIRLAMFSNAVAKFCDYKKIYRSFKLMELLAKTPGLLNLDKISDLTLPNIGELPMDEDWIEKHEAIFKSGIVAKKTMDPESSITAARQTFNEIAELAAAAPDKFYYLIECPTANLLKRTERILARGLNLPIQPDLTSLDSMILKSSYIAYPHFVPYSGLALWIAEDSIDPIMTAFIYTRVSNSFLYPVGCNFFIPYSVRTHSQGKEFLHKACIIGVKNKGGFRFVAGQYQIFIVGTLPSDVLSRLLIQLHAFMCVEFTYRIIDAFKMNLAEQIHTYGALVLRKQAAEKGKNLNLTNILLTFDIGAPVQLNDWRIGPGSVDAIQVEPDPVPDKHLVDRSEFHPDRWNPYALMLGCCPDLWVQIMADFAKFSRTVENSKPTSHKSLANRLFYDIGFTNAYNTWAVVLFGTKIKSIHLLCGMMKMESRRYFGFEPGEIEYMFACYHEGVRNDDEKMKEQIEIDESEDKLGPLPVTDNTLFKQDWVVIIFKLLNVRPGGKSRWHPSAVSGNSALIDYLNTTPNLVRKPAAHICAVAISKNHFTPQFGSCFRAKNTTSVFTFGLPKEFCQSIETRCDATTELGRLTEIARNFGKNDYEALQSILDSNLIGVLAKNKGAICAIMASNVPPKPKLVPNFNQIQHVPFESYSIHQQSLITWLREAYENNESQDDGRNMFITGKTGIGKSAFVNWLYRHFNVYELKESNGFFDGITPNIDLIVVDDVKLAGGVLGYLLHIMDSRKHPRFNVKFGSVNLLKNPRLLFLSNRSLEQYFDFQSKKIPEDEIAAYKRKFVQVELDVSPFEGKVRVERGGFTWRGNIGLALTVPYFLRFYTASREDKAKRSVRQTADQQSERDTVENDLERPNLCDVGTDVTTLQVFFDTREEKANFWSVSQDIPQMRRIKYMDDFPDSIVLDCITSLPYTLYNDEKKKEKTLEDIKAELNCIIAVFTNPANRGKVRDINWAPFGDHVTQSIKDLARMFFANTITKTMNDSLVTLLMLAKEEVIDDFNVIRVE